MTYLQERIWEELVDKYEFACLHWTPFTKIMDCPNFVLNEKGGCEMTKKCPKVEDYFRDLLEREV